MSDSFTVLWLAILVLGMVYLSFAYRLSYLKARRQFNQKAQAEGFAGKYLKDYQPRTTIHSIVNMLFTKPALIPDQTAVLAVPEFSDVSFWQGEIDWVKMQTKATKVIIRAGQGSWPDVQFATNYPAAKRAGMSRGSYWFYDSRIDPGRQAALFVSLIKDDIPELGAWCDFEHDYGGAFGGLRNAVAFMQEVERLLPAVKMGFYTGFYYMIENSNPIYNASQYAYLANKHLWLAWYGENVRVPAPWTKMYYHQFGTPADGREWGCESEEIDKNKDLSGDAQPPPPIPEPEILMAQYKFNVITNERSGPTATQSNLTGRVYQIGDVVTASLLPAVNASEQWFLLSNGNFAVYRYNSIVRAELVPAPPPAGGFPFTITGTSLTLHAVDEAGVRWQATVAVNMAEPVEFVRE